VSTRNPRALSYTIRVVLAAAEARRELRGLAWQRAAKFEFQLLAAATSELAQPPAEGWYDSQRQLKVTARIQGEELHLSVQAEGYEALRRVAGRSGRLRSADRILDVTFKFDQAGNAFAALKSAPDVHRALISFEIALDDSEQS
jgi:hypothetical protein